MTFHRLLWPTLITLPALAILIALGSWQVQRLHWKQDLIDARQAALTVAPITLPQDLSAPEALEYRRVVVRGSFLHDHELYLLNRTHKSQVGVQVVTPFRRALIDGGGIVLVNRGWVPHDRQDPGTRAEGQVKGDVEVTGIVRVGVTARGSLTPDNEPIRGQWYFPDPVAMAKAAGVAAPGLIIEAGPAKNAGGLPVGGQTNVALVNNHLSYALTWYGLAGALIGVYLIFALRRRA